MTKGGATRREALGIFAGFAAGSALSAGAARAQDLSGTGEVVVYDGGGAWGEAQRAAYFDPFQAETGIRVVAAAQIPPGPMRASVLAGAPAFDVVDLTGGQTAAFVRDDLLERIDYGHFAPGDRGAFSPIPATDYIVPSLFYSLALAYDKEAFPEGGPQTWADMWNVERFPGKRAIYNAGDDVVGGAVFETALLADGVAPEALYPIDFDRAFASLDRIKPDVLRFWTAGAEPAQLLSDASVTVTSIWNGRIAPLQAQGIPVELSWNQAILQWDGWAVLKGAANRENAMKFLAFCARPEQQARFSELIEYGPTNPKAFEHLSPERIAMLPGNPDSVGSQIVQDYDWWNQDSGNGKPNIEVAAELWQRWVTS